MIDEEKEPLLSEDVDEKQEKEDLGKLLDTAFYGYRFDVGTDLYLFILSRKIRKVFEQKLKILLTFCRIA